MDVDKHILSEALSAILGVTVKLQSDCKDLDGAIKLQIANLTTLALLKKSKSDECRRGDEPYKRPYGWMRFALKVRDKYPDGNAWLGTGGWRSRSAPGEWPVTYHGTDLQGAAGIIQSQYTAGNRQAYGRGIYSSPDINVADVFAKTKNFISQKNGKTYKVIMQNRINPKKREIKNKDIWLVPIPEGTSAEKEKEMVESSIRPYGLLLKKV